MSAIIKLSSAINTFCTQSSVGLALQPHPAGQVALIEPPGQHRVHLAVVSRSGTRLWCWPSPPSVEGDADIWPSAHAQPDGTYAQDHHHPGCGFRYSRHTHKTCREDVGAYPSQARILD